MLLLRIIFASPSNSLRQISTRVKNVRKMSYIPGIKPQKMNEQHYMNKDQIPKDYTIIYRAPMENYLTISKNITTITASVVTALVGYNLFMGEQLNNIAEETNLGDLMLGGPDLIIFASGFIFITLVLRIFISKYPLRIYKNNDKYIAVFQGQMPLKNSKLNFNKGEVLEVQPSALNPWSQSMFKIKNKKLLLLTDYFKTPSELTNMMLPAVTKHT